VKISALMRSEGSTKGARPEADRLVWEPVAGPDKSPVRGSDSRANRRKVQRLGRKLAHAEKVKSRQFQAAVRRSRPTFRSHHEELELTGETFIVVPKQEG